MSSVAPHSTPTAAATPMIGQAALYGWQAPELGTVLAVSPTPTCAAALSPGMHPKRNPSVDANEDAVAVVAGARATLLVVADGHWGNEASSAAVEAILATLGDPPPPDALTDHELVELVGEAERACAEHKAAEPDDRSRTTLLAALVDDEMVRWISAGDSSAMLISPGKLQQLTSPRAHYLGDGRSLPELAGSTQRGRAELSAGSWVVLATDGFTDFAHPEPIRHAEEVVTTASSAEDAARRLVGVANDGGAGDHVAVALAGPTG